MNIIFLTLFETVMTQSLIGSRKRGRSLGEDESRDFTPLSKRINNLHINTNGSCNDSSKGPLKQNLVDLGHSNGIHWNNISNGNINGSHNIGSNPQSSHGQVQVNGHNGGEASTSGVQMMGVSVRQDHHSVPAYNPDLGIGDNPFYYESNKLLFHLYQERLQRSSHSQY